MSPTSIEKKNFSKLKSAYSCGTNQKEKSAYSYGTEGVVIIIVIILTSYLFYFKYFIRFKSRLWFSHFSYVVFISWHNLHYRAVVRSYLIHDTHETFCVMFGSCRYHIVIVCARENVANGIHVWIKGFFNMPHLS